MNKFTKKVFCCSSCDSVKYKEVTDHKYDFNRHQFCHSKECKKSEIKKNAGGGSCEYVSGTEMKMVGEVKMSKCKYCTEEGWLDDAWESVGEPHHGSRAWCESCDGELYMEYGSGEIMAANNQALFNYPSLKKL